MPHIISFLPSTSRCKSKPYPTLKGSTGAACSCSGATTEGTGGDAVALEAVTSLSRQMWSLVREEARDVLAAPVSVQRCSSADDFFREESPYARPARAGT